VGTPPLHRRWVEREVNGLMFPSHRARNTVYIGDSTTPATS
jgi:hypothetical protein